MPGKVNPTQCEAVTMVAARVMGNDATLAFAAAGGQLELNVMLPVMAEAFLDSVGLLADVLDSFRERCVSGIRPNEERMRKNLESSLMLVTALTPKIGYERAAEIARHAHATGMTLKEATLALGALTEEEFDEAVRPEEMV
jgi:fumarate hydratase class II